MIRPVDDLLESFEAYYSNSTTRLKYNQAQRFSLQKAYAWIGNRYKIALYEHVIADHPASLRSLPDLAVIRKAAVQLGNPDIYSDPSDAAQIEDKTQDVFEKVDGSLLQLDNKRTTGDPDGVSRIRRRAKQGDATADELWWLKIQLEGGMAEGWKKMPVGWDHEQFAQSLNPEATR